MLLLDSYPISNGEALWIGLPGDSERLGQSFNAPSTVNLTSVRWAALRAYGSESGNCVAKLYAHTGTYGSTGTPTGSALATSNTVAVSTLPNMEGNWEPAIDDWLSTATESDCAEFTFGTPYEIQSGTKYFISIEYTVDNYILAIVDASSPTHGGNVAGWTGSAWFADSSFDSIFYIYGSSSAGIRSMRQLVGTGQGTRA